MPRHLAHTRIFVTLTLDEAAAVARLPPGADVAAIAALAKIRTALEGATMTPLPLLRAKDYRMAKATLPPPVPSGPPARARLKPSRGAPSPQPSALDVDYVPHRDEADGIYT